MAVWLTRAAGALLAFEMSEYMLLRIPIATNPWLSRSTRFPVVSKMFPSRDMAAEAAPAASLSAETEPIESLSAEMAPSAI